MSTLFIWGEVRYSGTTTFGVTPPVTYHSTNSGATWVPVISTGDLYVTSLYDAANGQIIFACNNSSTAPSQFYLRNYDLTSNTYGSTYGSSSAGLCGASPHLRKLSDGRIRLFSNLSGNVYSYHELSTATVWGSAIPIGTATASTFNQAVVVQDSVDTSWVVISDVGANLTAFTVDSTGVISTGTNLTFANPFTGGNPISNGVYWPGNTSVNFHAKQNVGGSVLPTWVYQAGAWAASQVNNSIAADFGQMSLGASGGLEDNWIGDAGDFDNGLYKSTWNGTNWQTNLIYNAVTNFPSGLTPNVFGTASANMQGISASQYGYVVRVTASNTISGAGNQLTLAFINGTTSVGVDPSGFPDSPEDDNNFFGPIALSPGIQISCPPSAAVQGQEYVGTFTTTGGTPPLTFSIIAGSLPPGLTFNSTSGVISGTAT